MAAVTDARRGRRRHGITRLAACAGILAGVLAGNGALATPIDLDATPEDPLIARARQLMTTGDVARARALLEQTISRDPGSIPARLLLGRSYLDDRPAAAREAAMAVLTTGPRSDEALDLLTTAYARRRTEGLSRADEVSLRAREIADYAAILERHPRWRDVLFRSAAQRLDLQRLLGDSDLRRREGELAAAVAELTRLVGLFDASRDPVVERASALYQLGRALRLAADFLGERHEDPPRRALFYQRAGDALARALEIDPGRIDAVSELARVALARDGATAAVRVIESRIEAIPAGPARAKLETLLGDLELRQGRRDDARRAFERALAADRGEMEAYLGLYRVHVAAGDGDAAEAAMRAAVDARPRFVLAHLKLGELRAARGDYAGAIGHFEHALAIPLESAVVLGMDPSRNAYRSSLYYRAAAWLAWLYLEHADDPGRALASVARAARFGPVDPRLADTEGWIHFRLGDLARARNILEGVARESGDFPAVHYHLARTYAALGMRDAASKAVRRALAFDTPFRDRAAAETLARELGAG